MKTREEASISEESLYWEHNPSPSQLWNHQFLLAKAHPKHRYNISHRLRPEATIAPAPPHSTLAYTTREDLFQRASFLWHLRGFLPHRKEGGVILRQSSSTGQLVLPCKVIFGKSGTTFGCHKLTNIILAEIPPMALERCSSCPAQNARGEIPFSYNTKL